MTWQQLQLLQRMEDQYIVRIDITEPLQAGSIANGVI